MVSFACRQVKPRFLVVGKWYSSLSIAACLLLLLSCLGCTSGIAHPTKSQKTGPRVISLVPSLTEIIYALQAQDQLVAVTSNDYYPPETQQLPKVGDMYPNLELIAIHHPTLVLVDSSLTSQDTITRLQCLHLNILDVEISNLDDLQKELPRLGRALNCPQRAAKLQQYIAQRLTMIEQRAATLSHRPKVFIEVWGSPLTTAGHDSLMELLVEKAGGDNIYTDQRKPYPVVSPEDLVKRDPEVIILTSQKASSAELLPGWQNLSALKNHRVIEIVPDLLQRPTLRALDGIEQVQDYLLELDMKP